MPENENYHGSRIVNDKVFQKYVKKNTKKKMGEYRWRK